MRKEINKFAFLGHPISLDQCYKIFPALKFSRILNANYLIKRLISRLPPIKYLHLRNIQSPHGETIEGYVILCPIFPEQFIEQKTLSKQVIIKACQLAQNLGAKIIGLGGFTSIITDGGKDILDSLKVAITSGNTYTSVIVIDSLLKAVKDRNKDLHNCNLCIVGATGDIGTVCVKILSKKFKNLYLIARDIEKLKNLKLCLENSCRDRKIIISTQLEGVVESADVILTATSSITTIIDSNALKDDVIICDVSYPPNLNRKLENGLGGAFSYEGGLVFTPFFNRSPRKLKEKIAIFNPLGALHGCICETMLLTFEGRFENYSFGKGGISAEMIDEMRNIGKKHGIINFPYIFGGELLRPI